MIILIMPRKSVSVSVIVIIISLVITPPISLYVCHAMRLRGRNQGDVTIAEEDVVQLSIQKRRGGER